jgi:hypothetical protein
MTQATVPETGGAPALSLPRRLLGVLFSPRPTFEAIVAHPKWLDVLALTTLVSALVTYAFISTDVGQQAFIDQQIQQREAWGQPITAEVEQQIRNSAPFLQYFVPGSILVAGPLFAVLIAAVLYGVFGAMLGGGGSFKQVLAVVAHAGVVPTVAGLGTTVLNYIQQSMTSRTNLSVFVQMLPEDSFIVRFLGMIDLVWIWYLIVLAIGVGVLYRRKPSSIGWTFLGIYLVIALIIAGARSALGGS